MTVAPIIINFFMRGSLEDLFTRVKAKDIFTLTRRKVSSLPFCLHFSRRAALARLIVTLFSSWDWSKLLTIQNNSHKKPLSWSE
jgi:hypothetical protein